MTLNRKIVVLLFAGITLYTVVGFLFNQFLILPSFVALEREEARTDMRRCLEALKGQIERIDLLCFDWAAWDDTYEFVEEPYEDYFDSNLIPESFVDNGINLMYFFRPDGSLVWSAFYDLEEGVPVRFPDFDAKTWRTEDPLIKLNDRDSKAQGLVRTSKGLLLFASRPILPSEETEGEEVRGTLIMGRLLDQELLERIRERTRVAVDVLYPGRDTLPAGAEDLATDEIRIEEVDPTLLRVLAHVHDFEGKDALVFQAMLPRTIIARGKSAILFNTMAAGLAGLLFLAMLLLSLKWVVTDPLEQLSAHVKDVGLSREMTPVAIRSRGDEIGVLAREFNTMLQRLKEEEASLVSMQEKVARSRHLAHIGEMGASVAHEIRNPLAGIKGALQILEGGGLADNERDEVAGAIHELVDRIENTVNQLLRYAKPIEPRLETFEIRPLLEAVSSEPPDGACVKFECDEKTRILGDPGLLRHVLENIWRNACQALAQPGTIRWTVRTDLEGASIALWNDGKSISEKDLPQVFDPFFTTRVDGSGLGLSLSLRIIEAHGGTMVIENAGEGGVTVTFRLPGGV